MDDYQRKINYDRQSEEDATTLCLVFHTSLLHLPHTRRARQTALLTEENAYIDLIIRQ